VTEERARRALAAGSGRAANILPDAPFPNPTQRALQELGLDHRVGLREVRPVIIGTSARQGPGWHRAGKAKLV